MLRKGTNGGEDCPNLVSVPQDHSVDSTVSLLCSFLVMGGAFPCCHVCAPHRRQLCSTHPVPSPRTSRLTPLTHCSHNLTHDKKPSPWLRRQPQPPAPAPAAHCKWPSRCQGPGAHSSWCPLHQCHPSAANTMAQQTSRTTVESRTGACARDVDCCTQP